MNAFSASWRSIKRQLSETSAGSTTSKRGSCDRKHSLMCGTREGTSAITTALQRRTMWFLSRQDFFNALVLPVARPHKSCIWLCWISVCSAAKDLPCLNEAFILQGPRYSSPTMSLNSALVLSSKRCRLAHPKNVQPVIHTKCFLHMAIAKEFLAKHSVAKR